MNISYTSPSASYSSAQIDREMRLLKRFAGAMDNFLIDPALSFLGPLSGEISTLLGTLLTLMCGGYAFSIAVRVGMPAHRRQAMLWRTAIDIAMDYVPLVGSVATLFYRSNMKNYRELEQYLGEIIS